ncbi:MAG: electron transport complex subunit RsxC [Actinomycetota bacterium]|nr:electron transport complex subunit RsxC [Actinomycetota bacterium]
MSKTLRLFHRIRGGIYPPRNKHFTRERPILKIEAPERVVIPLQQHIGTPCKPRVKKGDEVGVGTLIGDAEAYVSSPVHSSVSGKVAQVAPQPHPLGGDKLAVIIENDGLYTPDPSLRAPYPWREMPPEEIRKAVRSAGIVGMGGATFPTHVKLSPPSDSPIDTVIINGSECEPYLTSDFRLLVEEADLVVEGLNIIMKAVGAGKGIVAIADKKIEAIENVEATARGTGIEVFPLKTRYPAGAEKVLITNVLGREVPSGGLPMNVGVVVNNVGTSHAMAHYFAAGLPLVERVVTVNGSAVVNPSNLMIPLGTSFSAAVEACGGFREPPGKVIMGGPMMGLAQYTLDVPVIKGTSGILALSVEEAGYRIPTEPICIRCGRCVDACPMNLVPTYLASYTHAGKWDELRRFNILDCIECGCCTYVCPTKNPIVQLVKTGKAELARMKRREDKRKEELAAVDAEGGGDDGE